MERGRGVTTDKTDGLGNASNTTGPGGATATSNTTGTATNATNATNASNASNMGSVGTPENPSIVLATTILTSLVCEGVRWVAYCPGSRDAPFGYALASLERGAIPPSLGSSPLDPAVGIRVNLAPAALRCRVVLSNSFGFGGSNVSLLLGAA